MLVAVELALPLYFESRAWLPDVVKQRGEADEGPLLRGGIEGSERMLVDVVSVPFVLGHLVALQQLGEDEIEEVRFAKKLDALGGSGGLKKFHELFAETLGGDTLYGIAGAPHGREDVWREFELQHGGKADAAKGSEAVFLKARVRITDRFELLSLKVSETMVWVGERLGDRIVGERVDGEVTAGEIF